MAEAQSRFGHRNGRTVRRAHARAGPGAGAPDHGGFVLAPRDEMPAIGGKGEAADRAGMTFEQCRQLAAGEVVNADNTSGRAGGCEPSPRRQPFAFRGKRNGVNLARMRGRGLAADRAQRFARVHVPHPDGLVVRCRDELPSIRSEGDAVNCRHMPARVEYGHRILGGRPGRRARLLCEGRPGQLRQPQECNRNDTHDPSPSVVCNTPCRPITRKHGKIEVCMERPRGIPACVIPNAHAVPPHF